MLSEIGRYGQKTFGREQSIVPAWPWRQVSIRILVPWLRFHSDDVDSRILAMMCQNAKDPARIAHGMNFFWRRAHLLDAEDGMMDKGW